MSGYPRPRDVAPVPLRVLAEVAGGRTTAHVTVTGITHDSHSVQPGDLYAALPGAKRHGAEFAADALAAGAVAIMTDEAGAAMIEGAPAVIIVGDPRGCLGEVAAAVYGRPADAITMIGITGTAGKTSCAYLIESGLRQAGHTTAMIGTVETRLADETIDSVHTTPEPTDLHALLAVARQRGVTAAVMEVSSHALALGRVGGVRFEVGAFTNFGQDHLDFHPTRADYFAAKARLFDGRCRHEVLNLDDEAVRTLAKPDTITFSITGQPAATWRAEGITRDGFAQRFEAVGPAGVRLDAEVALPGRHNVANALLSLACLVAAGVDPATAAAGVAACRGVPGRLELVDAPGPVLGVVDYAHKPEAIVAALGALREMIGDARLVCVIGAGGDRDKVKRPLMGEAAARGADIVIVTDDNPRTEDPAAIRAEVMAGVLSARPAGAPRNRVEEIAGRREAIAAAVKLAEPGDVIALLGKGHERGQEVAGLVTPFDDRLELAAALGERFTA